MKLKLIVALGTSLILAPAALAESPVSSELKNPAGEVLGTVTVTSAPNGVLLRIEAKDLPGGWHGAHFHAKGDCSDAKFANAGGHVHQGDKVMHGLLNAAANDAGDLPNIFVGADGSVTIELYSTLTSLDGKLPRLNDADGFAVVIHANPDDYTSQPIGGAGDRIACAAFR
jgi:superoxide dismutase, Cu-Zn family